NIAALAIALAIAWGWSWSWSWSWSLSRWVLSRRQDLTSRGLARRQIVGRWPVDGLARNERRRGLRPGPPAAPTLSQCVGDRQRQLGRSAHRKDGRACRSHLWRALRWRTVGHCQLPKFPSGPCALWSCALDRVPFGRVPFGPVCPFCKLGILL